MRPEIFGREELLLLARVAHAGYGDRPIADRSETAALEPAADVDDERFRGPTGPPPVVSSCVPARPKAT